ncbi:Gfo/Idh/MocA family oxidoreductase [Microvirga sp. CF3062]|uniref:Gfo/Idh/MocA family protein n=1 Tax=Microvirga sp. CF3062 TaxID=3110182 RepID=UPI002E797787|nr:Gfo/Idh/MocA family oxidoreductase [Microvirga sp. CF3062]MEE1654740.1 Gfo/Idh/MocA family oxidoreductase [Microvirga sp. CF3062]
MTSLNVGIIGCGNISGIYLQNIPAYHGLNLRACADMRPEVAQAQASRHGIEAMTVDQLLARDDIDLVVNLTVPAAHFGVSLAALSAGKHVFSEKPLAVDFEQGRRLVDEAEARGLHLGCAPDTFLGAGGRLARKLVDDGAIGRILSGTAFLMSHGMEHWHPDPEFFFKPGGGPILDMAPYYLSTLVNLIGPVQRVFAMSSIGFPERVVTAESPRKGHSITVETPTHVTALLEFASGAQVTFCMSWDVWKHSHPAIEIYGSEGSLRVPDPNFFGGHVEVTERGGDWRTVDSSEMPLGVPNWRSPNWAPEMPNKANYRALGLADLASAVLNGTPHRSSGRLGLHVLEVMHSILEGAATGQPRAITTALERPATLEDADASILWKGLPQTASAA